jgi:DNA-binding response OmpR family regulator
VPRRILLVHDDLAEIAAVRRALAAAGDEVLLATNASDALAALGAERPDAVLLAPECDGGDGAAVGREVGGATPLILIGGEGATAYRVRRPLEADEVRAVVASAVRSAPTPTSIPTATPTSTSTPTPTELSRSSAALDADRRRALEEEDRRRAAALAWVAAKVEQVRRADYFAILDLTPAATTEDVREAARRILSEAAVDRYGPDLPEALTAELEELREVVSEAGEILADPELRARYRAAISPPEPRE